MPSEDGCSGTFSASFLPATSSASTFFALRSSARSRSAFLLHVAVPAHPAATFLGSFTRGICGASGTDGVNGTLSMSLTPSRLPLASEVDFCSIVFGRYGICLYQPTFNMGGGNGSRGKRRKHIAKAMIKLTTANAHHLAHEGVLPEVFRKALNVVDRDDLSGEAAVNREDSSPKGLTYHRPNPGFIPGVQLFLSPRSQLLRCPWSSNTFPITHVTGRRPRQWLAAPGNSSVHGHHRILWDNRPHNPRGC